MKWENFDMHDKPEFPRRNKAGNMLTNSIRYMHRTVTLIIKSQVMMMILVTYRWIVFTGRSKPVAKIKCSCDVGNLHISFRQLHVFAGTKKLIASYWGGRKN